MVHIVEAVEKLIPKILHDFYYLLTDITAKAEQQLTVHAPSLSLSSGILVEILIPALGSGDARFAFWKFGNWALYFISLLRYYMK